ncbi:MAG: porin family protein [Nitrosomonas sp.]|nr:porin family protein [Nitrosomonas sp.]
MFNLAQRSSPILAGLLIISVAIYAPQVAAHDKARALERKVQELENMLRAVQSELQQVKADSKAEAERVIQVQDTAIKARDTAIQAKEQATSTAQSVDLVTERVERKNRMLFFRGGFTHAMERRDGSSIRSDVAPVGAQDQADKNGWYVGAGFDWSLTRDAWGMLPGAQVFAELMFEYKNFSNGVLGNALANNPTILAGGALNPRSVTVSQFTLTAAPKIKFMEGSRIRPWIIPMGLAMHVVSPTTESITYLVPGVMFGAGIDYNIWKDFFIGIDGRYQLTAGKSDGVKVDGMTAGGYVGIGF